MIVERFKKKKNKKVNDDYDCNDDDKIAQFKSN